MLIYNCFPSPNRGDIQFTLAVALLRTKIIEFVKVPQSVMLMYIFAYGVVHKWRCTLKGFRVCTIKIYKIRSIAVNPKTGRSKPQRYGEYRKAGSFKAKLLFFYLLNDPFLTLIRGYRFLCPCFYFFNVSIFYVTG